MIGYSDFDLDQALVYCKNWLGDADFFDWRHKWSSFRVILADVAWPRAWPLG